MTVERAWDSVPGSTMIVDRTWDSVPGSLIPVFSNALQDIVVVSSPSE